MDKATIPSSNIKKAEDTNIEASQPAASTSHTPDPDKTPNKNFGPAESKKSLLKISQARASYLRPFRQFGVLMWKHLVVRKRRFIVTFIELFSPSFFFLLLFFLKPLLNVDDRGTHDDKASLRSNEVPIQNIMAPQLVLYSPATILTGKLMDRAGQMMGLTRLNMFPNEKSRGYYAIPEESLFFINDLVEKMNSDSVIVIFQGLVDEEECPVKLNYTIRMKKVLRWVEDDIVETNDIISEPILRLQASIDFSFLNLCSSKQVENRATSNMPTVALSEFPTLDFRNTSLVCLVCDLLRIVCPISLIPPFVFLFNRLVQERAFGVQELIKQVGVSYDIWATSHVCNMFLTELCYSISGTIICKVTSNAFIPNSDGFLLFTFFELHFHSTMMFAFLCSYVSKTGEYSTTLAIAAFVVSSVPAKLVEEQELPGIVQHLTGILPHVPVMWFWWEVETLEIKDKGLNVKDIWTHHSKYSQPAMVAYVWLSLQIVVFFCLAGYLNSVCPGKYGTSKPWNYLFKKKEDYSPIALQEVQEKMIQRDKRYFEESHLPNVGISIDNVTKIYGKDIILSKVSFNMNEGEITVLLGDNSAGKSTLLSIITGMVPLTSGKVYVSGMDISQEQTEVQSVMGICPLADMFVPSLTVMEHVRFFSMLKGHSWKDSKETSKEILQKLGIMDKKDHTADTLSSDKRRRLQLACALSGGSNVLILDKPTSGLDVETRHELWNLLLSLRRHRTVLLTTHFLEEAEALGDRVAVLHGGKLRSHASPMYLKKTIGKGYRLSLTTTRRSQVQKITALVRSIIPDAKMSDFKKRTISYSLPATESAKFPLLFTRLEEKRSKLEILTIGVGVSSLEEVFMKLCRDDDIQFDQDVVHISLPETKYSKIYGVVLYGRQMCVLMRRHFRFLVFRKYSFLILEIIIPLAFLTILFWNLRVKAEKEQTEPKTLSALNLDVYGDKSKNTVLVRLNSHHAMRAFEKLEDKYNNVEFERTRDVNETIFRTPKGDHSIDMNGVEPKNYVIGIEINDSKANVMYNKSAHAAPLALNLLSNILAAQYMPRSGGITITTTYQPLPNSFLPLKDEEDVILKSPKALITCMVWICILIVIVVPTVSNSVVLPIIDRETGTRHIHIMSGCPPAVHWITTLLFHTLVYTVVLLTPATFLSILDEEATFSSIPFMGSLLVILVVGCIAYLLCCYLITYNYTRGRSRILLAQLAIIAGIVPGIILFSAQIYRTEFPLWVMVFSKFFYCVFPVATLTVASLKAANVARLNALCSTNYSLCVNIMLENIFKKLPATPETKGFDPQKCCAVGRSKKCTLCFDEFASGYELIILGLQIAVYGTLVVLSEYGIFSGIQERIFNSCYKPKPSRYNDKQVEMEKIYVDHQIRKPLDELLRGNDAMLVHDLHKNYFNFCKKNSNSVKGVNFSVKKGECFGLLGVNGAGKSSIFKMITGEQVHTQGHIYSTGQLLSFPRSGKYLHSLGYSPQYFGLDEFQSGHNNLATLLTLRGLNSNDVIQETRKWIDLVGLAKYRDVLVADYSGSCVRCLATVAALSSNAPVTLLDDPTCGVDVSSRRKVWLALRKSLRENHSVFITSQSIDEMEAVCDRIAILSSGEMCALGSAPALRAAYAAGHTLSIKLKSDGISPKNHQKLKVALHLKFNCTLKDDRITMMLYHINQTMAYSDIFTNMEQLKETFPDLIEDYSVTDTTLDEVFLSFAQPAPTERS